MRRRAKAPARHWDRSFAAWIAEGEAKGVDPNDIGDREWLSPRRHIEERFLPWIQPDSVVLELGPGTGRITRHVIERCREMILVDYSRFVCDWLEQYLAGKDRFRVHCIEVMTEERIAWLRRFRGEPGHVNIFRFYHPETVRRLAEAAGFIVEALRTNETRRADIDLVKPKR